MQISEQYFEAIRDAVESMHNETSLIRLHISKIDNIESILDRMDARMQRIEDRLQQLETSSVPEAATARIETSRVISSPTVVTKDGKIRAKKLNVDDVKNVLKTFDINLHQTSINQLYMSIRKICYGRANSIVRKIYNGAAPNWGDVGLNIKKSAVIKASQRILNEFHVDLSICDED